MIELTGISNLTLSCIIAESEKAGPRTLEDMKQQDQLSDFDKCELYMYKL